MFKIIYFGIGSLTSTRINFEQKGTRCRNFTKNEEYLNIENSNVDHKFKKNYYNLVIVPASQWYLGGTDCHCFDNFTIPPASSTPNPNK